MKAEWTKTGDSTAVTLGDDSAKKAIVLESLPMAAQEQVSPLFRAANPLRIARGNVSGEVAFTVGQSFATADLAAAWYKGELARINQSGALKLTFTSTTFTYAGANLLEVTCTLIKGVRWHLRYRFGITTVS